MTSGHNPSSPSAARLGGFALIGVGALAAVVGTATLVSGGSEDAAAPAPPPNAAPLPPLPPQPQPAPAPQPEKPAEPPQAQQPPEQPPSPEQPPAPPAEPPRQDPGAGQVQQQQHVRVRVYNNSTIKGLAARAAQDFRTAGYEVPEVGNFARGTIPTTTVYYRPGTDEELQARELATLIQAEAKPRFPGAAPDNAPGLIAIITNDYKGFSGGKGGS